MGDDLIGVILVAFILTAGHVLTCRDCRDRTVEFLDDLVERIAFGRRKP
jgi:hypothetical protein